MNYTFEKWVDKLWYAGYVARYLREQHKISVYSPEFHIVVHFSLNGITTYEVLFSRIQEKFARMGSTDL